jgi:Relaxase/Mobilisation nuclease domain
VIGNITTGNYFRGCVDYLLGKEQAEIIGGSLLTSLPWTIAAEFNAAWALNQRASTPVYHLSISLDREESLCQEAWCSIADRYMAEMNFIDNQYLVVQHHDQLHQHIHILANRIDLNGKAISDGWSKRRTEMILRRMEQDFDLRQIPCSWHTPDLTPAAHYHKSRRQLVLANQAIKPLQLLIDKAIASSTSISSFQLLLQSQGIEVRLRLNALKQVVGISYRRDEVSFKGSQLGRNYSAVATLQRLSSEVTIENSIPVPDQQSVNAVQLRNQLVEDAEMMSEQSLPEDMAIDTTDEIIDEEDWELSR